MYQEEKITLQPVGKKKEDLYIEGYGKHWGEKLTFTVGITYCTAAFFGIGLGIRDAMRLRKTYKQMEWYRTINTVGKTIAKCGNASAAASLLYCLTTTLVDLVLEEEIQDFGRGFRNTMSGALTGAFYKSSLGIRPMVVGSLFGMGIINIVSYSINFLNESGFVRFGIDVEEMELLDFVEKLKLKRTSLVAKRVSRKNEEQLEKRIKDACVYYRDKECIVKMKSAGSLNRTRATTCIEKERSALQAYKTTLRVTPPPVHRVAKYRIPREPRFRLTSLEKIYDDDNIKVKLI